MMKWIYNLAHTP